MPIPKLYTVLPLKDGNPDVDALTSHSSNIVTGSNDETFVVLSYFPEKLKYSAHNNRVFNKYVLFILNGSDSIEYTADWEFDIINGEESILHDFNSNEKINIDGFEYMLGIQDNRILDSSDWDLQLKISCKISKDGEEDEVLELQQTLLPIESDLLSENGSSFEDESGLDNTSVRLGNEGTTHFMRGHVGSYLVDKKQSLSPDERSFPGSASNNASIFVNDCAAIIYNNALSVLPTTVSSSSNEPANFILERYFSLPLANKSIEKLINSDGEYPAQNPYKEIGLCSLNLHHVHSFLHEEENTRIEQKENEEDKICKKLKTFFDSNKDNFIQAYLRSIFPKSAIELSVSILDTLFKAFQEQASAADRIYETYQSSDGEKNATIDKWKKLNYSELPDSDTDKFLKNLLAEYHLGFNSIVNRSMISGVRPQKITKIDWSQFIQKILNPSTVAVPFTLIKIQVLDLRSGKPIRNALVNRIQFQSFQDAPSYLTDEIFSYVMENPHDSSLMIKSTDSRNRRVQKICKLMGYYTSSLDDGFGDGMSKAIYKYLTSSDRLLSTPIKAPESDSKADVIKKKDAWIDYIIDDFTSNCITDDNGILNCRIPDELLKKGKLNINVGFTEFAVVREISEGEDDSLMANVPIRRAYSFGETGSTNFMAHWVGDAGSESSPNPNEQSLSWESSILNDNNFGWKITEHTGMAEGTETSTTNQLKVAISLEVKKSSSKEYSYLKLIYPQIHEVGYSTEHFSTFFEDTDVHFVLFGMQWCQPVWDEYDDTETVNGNPKHSYEQDSATRHPRMHLVTLMPQLRGDFGKYPGKNPEKERWDEYGGKGYAKYEANNAPNSVWRGGNSHRGYDIHARIGANVFAYHNGIITSQKSNNAGGDWVRIRWKKHDATNDDEFTEIYCTHLDGDTGFLKTNGEFVLAGTLVAKGGRTGNIGENSFNPSHVHLTVGNAGGKYYPQLRKTMDDDFPENAHVLPSNYSPLLFPCRGETPLEDWDAKNCQLDNARFVRYCWAAGELKCPYINKGMNKLSETTYQLQSQLRYLNEKPATVEKNDLDPEYLIKSEESTSFPNHVVDLSAFLKVNNNTNYYHPGTTLGTLGDPMTKIENSELTVGTALSSLKTKWSNTNHKLKRVKYEESPGVKKTTWIEQTFIAADNTISELIQNVPAVEPSKTQMAVYAFRSQHGLLKMEDYYLNFTTDDEFWAELNRQCGF